MGRKKGGSGKLSPGMRFAYVWGDGSVDPVHADKWPALQELIRPFVERAQSRRGPPRRGIHGVQRQGSQRVTIWKRVSLVKYRRPPTGQRASS